MPFGGEFSEIMPEAGEVAPLVSGLGLLGIFREHFGGEFGGVVGHFIEVAVGGFHLFAFLAEFALALVCRITKRGEERFPFLLRSFGKGMRVGRLGHWGQRSRLRGQTRRRRWDYLCGGFGGCWGGGGAEVADDAGGIPDGGEGSPGFRAAEAEDVAVHFRKEVADGTELRAQGDCQGTAARNGGHDG